MNLGSERWHEGRRQAMGAQREGGCDGEDAGMMQQGSRERKKGVSKRGLTGTLPMARW